MDVFPITTRVLQVLRVADVTPGMRRVTLGGPLLAAHTAPNGFPVQGFRSEGFDDEFKLILKHPDAAQVVGPTQADGVLNWPREDPHLVMRTYTVRRWDPEAGELDVDLVLHGAGPATSWARGVQPGESIQVAGPTMSEGDPVGADWILAAGDETALPAIGRWLEHWPAGVPGQVFVEVAEPAHRQELAVPDGVELTWLSRDGAPAGTTTLLLDALTSARWDPGTPFAWVAGEALSIAPIRRWLRREKKLTAEQVQVDGYWRVQKADPARPADEPSVHARMHELIDIMPGFAARVAVSVGLIEALSGGPVSFDALVADTGTDAVGTARLLRYLGAVGFTEQIGERWALTALGNELAEEHSLEELDFNSYTGRRTLGVLALTQAVRGGRGNYAELFGAEFAELVQAEPEVLRRAVRWQSYLSAYVATALAASSTLTGSRSVLVAGTAAGDLAVALTRADPERRVTVVTTPAEVEALTRVHGQPARVTWSAGDPDQPPAGDYDVVLLSGVLAGLADDAAERRLRNWSLLGGRLHLLENLLDAGADADDEDYAEDLLDFAIHGSGTRDPAQTDSLVGRAGLAVTERGTVGWGTSLLRLEQAGTRLTG
ncbi:siderophore-interacting protein [Naumannella halotolerans]|nr:siderophore-interacting protein [Naumannella halotolerans]